MTRVFYRSLPLPHLACYSFNRYISRRRPNDRPAWRSQHAPPLESEFGVFEAPLEDYDVVELTRFDRPLARGRVAFGDGFAVVGPVRAVDGDGVALDHDAVVLARLAEEAFIEGADVVYAPVDAGAADRYEALGWTRAGELAPKGECRLLRARLGPGNSPG